MRNFRIDPARYESLKDLLLRSLRSYNETEAYQLARDAETVQGMYQDYQELSLSRQGLKRLYGLSLTMALLLALARRIPEAAAESRVRRVLPG